jgi:hypothetical protein
MSGEFLDAIGLLGKLCEKMGAMNAELPAIFRAQYTDLNYIRIVALWSVDICFGFFPESIISPRVIRWISINVQASS